MDKYILLEGEARLLVAVFEHLGEYSERANANDTSVSDELSESTEDISVYVSALRHAMRNCLSDREREVIARRYELSPYKKCSTREEIARDFNVTRERIRQVEAKALRKIKRYMTELTDEETDKVVYNLQADVQEHLMDATRAYVAGDSVSEEVYDHYWTVGTNAINKLKIQQAIRKYREGTE